MASFNYRAVGKDGKEKKGTIEANDQAQATAQIKNMGLMPISVTEANAMNKDLNIQIGKAVSSRDISVFCRQFVSMLNAGITIIDAVEMLGEQSENKPMKAALKDIRSDIGKGETMASAMARHEKVFPSLMINMVAAGEASGRLPEAMEHMGEHFEKDAKIRGMMKKAAMYPMILVIVAIAVMVIMLVKVLPGYAEMFEDMDVEMPMITQVVMAMSDFIIANWLILVLVIGGAVAGILAFKRTESGQFFFGSLQRKIPGLGTLNIKTQASIFSRTLSTLLASGLTMVEALDIVADAMPNALYRRGLKEAREEVVKGVPLSEPVAASGLYPPMVTHMIRIGEETGDVGDMLHRLSKYYDEEVEMATQTAMAALEPVIILFMAGIVIVLIASVLSPMMAMYQGMGNL